MVARDIAIFARVPVSGNTPVARRPEIGVEHSIFEYRVALAFDSALHRIDDWNPSLRYETQSEFRAGPNLE